MILTLEQDNGERVTLFGVSDFEINNNGVLVHLPVSAAAAFDVQTELPFNDAEVVSALSEQACDLTTIYETVMMRNEESNHTVTVLPSEAFPGYNQVLRILDDDFDYDPYERFVPGKNKDDPEPFP